MPGYTRRAYAGGAAATTISATINSTATTITIAGYTGWPSGANPFYIVIDPGNASEEKILVTRTGSTDTTLNVQSGGRGVDGTTASSHSSGATIYPVFTAVDADEANTVASTLTTKGDVLAHTGSAHTRVGVGANNTVLTADSAETSGLKWAAVLSPTIVDAKGDLIVGSAADTAVRLAVGATNGMVLAVNSSTATGLEWQTITTNFEDDQNILTSQVFG